MRFITSFSTPRSTAGSTRMRLSTRSPWRRKASSPNRAAGTSPNCIFRSGSSSGWQSPGWGAAASPIGSASSGRPKNWPPGKNRRSRRSDTGCTSISTAPAAGQYRSRRPSGSCCRRPASVRAPRGPRYARPMPFVSKTVEVAADAASILAIVADFESYPQWNQEIKGLWVLARYDDGRPSQLRLDAAYEAIEDTLIQAVYYPGPNQIQTVMQQGNLFKKQEQLFSVVEMGATSLLTVDMDVEPALPVPAPMVKKLADNVLDYLAENLKRRAEELSSEN